MGLTAEDQLAIMDTLSRYNQAIDGMLPDSATAWADTFTEDGTFRALGDLRTDSSRSGQDRAKVLDAAKSDNEALIALNGREELLAFANSVIGVRSGPHYHWVNNVIIEGDGDRATMTCYLRTMEGKTAEHPEMATVTGYYRDQLRKVGDSWKFESRVVSFDG